MKKFNLLLLLLINSILLMSQNCFTSHNTYSSTAWPTAVHSADFNGDGYKDIIAATVTNANLMMYLGSLTGTFSSGTSIPIVAASWDLVSGDFNGDGKRDLAAACSGTGSIAVLLGTGLGTFTSIVGYAMTTPQIVSIAAADFNNDGILDIVGEDFNSGVFYRILGAGNGTFGSATSFTTGGTNPYALCTGDFNNDGNKDVAIVNGVTNNVGVAFGTGTGSFVLNATYSVGPFPQDIIAADFNNDGKTDLATANINGGSVSILLGSSSGTFASSVNYPAGSTGITSIKAGDFNVDGNMDIVGANFGNSYVEVYLNNGSGVFSIPQYFTVGTNPNSVDAADFNNDGKTDIATSNKNSSNISVLLNYSFTISASASSSAICLGNSTTLTASGASTYTWNGGTNAAVIVVTPTSNANYTVVGRNSSGCTNTVVSTITVNALPSLTTSIPTNTFCAGRTATLSVNGASTYTWNPGAMVGATVNPIPLTNTIYSVSGTNSIGCISSINTATIVVYGLPTVSVNSGSICGGQNFTLLPGGAATYTISGGSTVVSPIVMSSYSVTGTSTAGCISSNTAIATVSVNNNPTVSVNSGSICVGQFFTMTPSGANSYTFQGGNSIVSPSSNMSYTVAGTSTAGCVSLLTATSNVLVNANPTISVNSGSICVGQFFTMTPSGANSYTFQGGNSNVSPSSNTSYTVAGTSTAGCVSLLTATSNVLVNSNPTISVNSGSICAGQFFTITPSGANSYTFQGGNANVSPSSNSSYTVAGTSTAGCVSSVAAVSNVTVNAIPNLVVTSTRPLICLGESTTLTVSGATTYTWSDGANINTIVVSPIQNTSYTVSGKSSAGCINTAIVTQTVDACLNLTGKSSELDPFLIFPNPNNGDFFISYTKSDGAEFKLFNALGKSIFSLLLENGKTERISLGGIRPGIYYFFVFGEFFSANGKLIIE